MSVPSPKERPDYSYWSKPRAKRTPLSDEEMAELLVDLANYSHRRFQLGRRFRLVRNFCGIPKGTGCEIIATWPQTEVQWDRWTRTGYGSSRPKSLMSFELDILLEFDK